MKTHSFCNLRKKNSLQFHPVAFVLSISFMFLTLFSSNGAYINADRVYLRSNHSTKASSLLLMNKGQYVEVLNKYRPSSNFDEAILISQTNFYQKNSGIFMFTLPKGKAVKIVSKNGNNYYVSFRNDQTGAVGYTTISGNLLEFIGGDVWYFVKVNELQGWVFGKFVTFY